VSSVDLITLGLLALQVGFVLMMIVYLISGLDDLFVDLLFCKQSSGSAAIQAVLVSRRWRRSVSSRLR
jgi:uncharacterized membrane protein YpjA